MNGTAYVDEAGEKGLVRKVEKERDSAFGLMCAVLIVDSVTEEVRAAFEPEFVKFCEAAPEGAKIHITDAFTSGNESWAAVAQSVRESAFSILDRDGCVVLYDARRLGVVRESFKVKEELVNSVRQAQSSEVSVSQRPDSQRIDDQLVQGIVLKADAYAQDHGIDQIDLLFDELDEVLRKGYEKALCDTQTLEHQEHKVKGWNLKDKAPVSGVITIEVHAPLPLDVTHIGTLKVAGKSDPLVLLADIVTNALNHHLRSLDSSHPLNAPASVRGWRLENRVWGVRDDAIEDII